LGPTGEVDLEEGFDGLRRRFKRDKAGRVVEVERPDGRVTKYAYDLTGRVLAVTQPEAATPSGTGREMVGQNIPHLERCGPPGGW
jgi:YD repeat-containing protein